VTDYPTFRKTYRTDLTAEDRSIFDAHTSAAARDFYALADLDDSFRMCVTTRYVVYQEANGICQSCDGIGYHEEGWDRYICYACGGSGES
jgi:hypothetical protein